MKTAFVLSLVALTMAAVAWWRHGEVGEAARQLALRRESRQPALARPAPSLVEKSPAPAAAPARAMPDGGRVAPFNPTLFIARNPELRQLQVRIRVHEQRLAFAALLHELRFTPEQLARFDRLQAEYEEALLDAAIAADAQGWAPGDPRAALARRALAERRDARRREELGIDDAPWSEFARAAGARQVVHVIAQQTLQGEAPLDPGAAGQLVRILLESHDAALALAPGSDRTGYDWAKVYANASATLAPAQFQPVKTTVEWYRAQMELSAWVARREKERGR